MPQPVPDPDHAANGRAPSCSSSTWPSWPPSSPSTASSPCRSSPSCRPDPRGSGSSLTSGAGALRGRFACWRTPIEQVRAAIAASEHTRFPACRGSDGDVVGVLHVKDLLEAGETCTLVSGLLREPLYVNDGMSSLKLLDQLRRTPLRMAIVLDEFGSFEGLVTPTDILAAIAGSLGAAGEDDEPGVVRRDDGSWLLDGKLTLLEAERALGTTGMHSGHAYATVAGFVLQHLGHLPQIGEAFTWQDWRIEVVDMDGRRIDRAMVQRCSDPASTESGGRCRVRPADLLGVNQSLFQLS